MAQQRYFLPRGLKSALEHETAQGFTTTEARADILGYQVDGFIIPAEEEQVVRFMAKATVPGCDHHDATMRAALTASIAALKKDEKSPDLNILSLRKEHAVIGRELLPLITVQGSVMVDVDHLTSLNFRHSFMDDIHETLRDFSALSGRSVRLHTSQASSVRPFLHEENMLNVVVGSGPPGETTTLEHSELCGIHLWEEEKRVSCPGPTKGYGLVVRDDKENPVAQIVGNTIYMLLPTESRFQRVLRSRSGAGLFEKAFKRAWNAFAENKTPLISETVSNADAYSLILADWRMQRPKDLEVILEGVESLLRSNEAEHRSLLAQKRVLLRELHLHRAQAKETGTSAWETDWERIAGHPSIQRVCAADEGLHIETHPLVLTHEDTRYQLGTFLIRIGQTGVLTILPLSVTHGDSKAHPHIGRWGNPCLGNVSSAIDRAIEEMRIADAVHLILQWLTEGYDPSLAETPISEWPTVQESNPCRMK